jgi:hypothetical protein
MKKGYPVILLLAAISVVSGYLFSKVSWIGRIGINWFYSEYSIFKSWWKSSLLVFGIYLALYFIHWLMFRKARLTTSKAWNITTILFAIGGLYYTYYDFRHDFSHKVAGERFHLGFYLSWLGWIIISLYFLTKKKPAVTT